MRLLGRKRGEILRCFGAGGKAQGDTGENRRGKKEAPIVPNYPSEASVLRFFIWSVHLIFSALWFDATSSST